jgi:hypothetical protein
MPGRFFSPWSLNKYSRRIKQGKVVTLNRKLYTNNLVLGTAMLVALLFMNGILAACAQDNNLLASRLKEYAVLYPDISFMHLKGTGKDKGIATLRERLGVDAVNLDYEHDPISQQDLLRMQFMRINFLQNNNMPSATLFYTGKYTAYHQPYVCVITLDESQFLTHANASTEFMLGETMRDSLQSENKSLFDNNTFLLYTLDHEVYHCLDAYMHGPSMSKDADEKTAAYEHFLSEYRADLYASLTLRQSNPSTIDFLHLLVSYRVMGLVDLDTEHYTVAAIRQVMDFPESEINNTGLADTARGIRALALVSQPSIVEYAQLINAASGLALYLNIENETPGRKSNIARDLPNSPQLTLIIQEYEGATSYITSNLYLEDDPG